jgi:hypothetical protein
MRHRASFSSLGRNDSGDEGASGPLMPAPAGSMTFRVARDAKV